MTREERREQLGRRLRERWPTSVDQWRAKVQRWADAGIVSRDHDGDLPVTLDGDRLAPSSADVISRSHETLSYLLLLLLGVSAVMFLHPYWAAIGRAGHVTVALLVAGDSLIVGATIIELREGAARRLGGLLWLIATVALATSVSDMTTSGAQHLGLRLLVVGLTTLLMSVVLWRNQNLPLQFLSAVTGFILTMCGLATEGRVHTSPTALALFVCLCAIALGMASVRTLRPTGPALLVAVIGCCVGSLALTFPHPIVGIALGLVTTVIAVALGALLVRPALLVLGTLGFFMFDIRAFSLYLRSSSSALGAGVLGLIAVCVGLWHALHTEARERDKVTRAKKASLDCELLERS